MPVAITVETGIDAVEENEANFGIYPNPATDKLNIVTNAESYEYQLVNSVGQVVMSGSANGNTELNVSGMNSGVYFIKVIANGSANIQKVVIK